MKAPSLFRCPQGSVYGQCRLEHLRNTWMCRPALPSLRMCFPGLLLSPLSRLSLLPRATWPTMCPRDLSEVRWGGGSCSSSKQTSCMFSYVSTSVCIAYVLWSWQSLAHLSLSYRLDVANRLRLPCRWLILLLHMKRITNDQ